VACVQLTKLGAMVGGPLLRTAHGERLMDAGLRIAHAYVNEQDAGRVLFVASVRVRDVASQSTNARFKTD